MLVAVKRACFVLPVDGDTWRVSNLGHGFRAAADQLREAGWQVEVFDAQPGPELAADRQPEPLQLRRAAPDALAILSGPGPEDMTRTLRAGHRVARDLAADPPDLVVAPLAGGIAQPLLMARATNEAFGGTAVALWADAPAAARLAQDDAAVTGPGPLVDDALERIALRFADRILASGAGAVRQLERIGPCPPCRFVSLPRLPPDAWAEPFPISEIVFVGPASRRYGLPAFLDAAEALQARGWLVGRQVTLLGPMREAAAGLSKTLIGIRAQNWPFTFSLQDVATVQEAWGYLQRPGVLAVFAGEVVDDDTLSAAVLQSGRPMLAVDAHPSARLLGADRVCPATAAGIFAGVERLLSHPAPRPGVDQPAAWPQAVSDLSRAPRPFAAPTPTVAVCITHRDRPALLMRAHASVAAGGVADAAVIVVDNASSRAYPELEDVAGMPNTAVIRLADAVPQAAACNLAASAAEADVVVFLDDDNTIAPQGLARFATACQDAFDVVVSPLDLCDAAEDGVADGPASARLIFMGDAGSAGLFFNGFGDTAMAFRRDAFLRLGGFSEGPYAAPGLDWILLARARAAGLRIGALHYPAIRYTRDLRDQDRKWRKNDQEGVRGAVLAAYGGAFDAGLVARVAQGAALGLF